MVSNYSVSFLCALVKCKSSGISLTHTYLNICVVTWCNHSGSSSFSFGRGLGWYLNCCTSMPRTNPEFRKFKREAHLDGLCVCVCVCATEHIGMQPQDENTLLTSAECLYKANSDTYRSSNLSLYQMLWTPSGKQTRGGIHHQFMVDFATHHEYPGTALKVAVSPTAS